MPRARIVLIALAVTGAALLAGVSGCAFWRLDRAAELLDRSRAFEAAPPQVALRLLVVGDSTAVGTGASRPQQSLPGLAAAAFPKLLIENRAVNGARYLQVVEQLRAAPANSYDFVLIMAGGNDVIRQTGSDILRAQIGQAVTLAGSVGRTVILMPSGNVGNAPLFFAPLSWLMSSRSRELHRLVREVAQTSGAIYVDLYKEAADDPFVQQPDHNAVDGLHPSDRGYRQWWSELQQQAHLATRWAAARS